MRFFFLVISFRMCVLVCFYDRLKSMLLLCSVCSEGHHTWGQLGANHVQLSLRDKCSIRQLLVSSAAPPYLSSSSSSSFSDFSSSFSRSSSSLLFSFSSVDSRASITRGSLRMFLDSS